MNNDEGINIMFAKLDLVSKDETIDEAYSTYSNFISFNKRTIWIWLITYSGIYPSSFDVSYTAQKTSLSTEFWNSILTYISVCLFVLLLRYWSSFAAVILAVKIKRYLHVSYMQLFDYLHIHNITYITYLNLWKMKIYSLNT